MKNVIKEKQFSDVEEVKEKPVEVLKGIQEEKFKKCTDACNLIDM